MLPILSFSYLQSSDDESVEVAFGNEMVALLARSPPTGLSMKGRVGVGDEGDGLPSAEAQRQQLEDVNKDMTNLGMANFS